MDTTNQYKEQEKNSEQNDDFTLKMTEEEFKYYQEHLKVCDDNDDPAKTKLLKSLTFRNKRDEYVFDRLPLSDKQKEELLISLYCNDEEMKQYLQLPSVQNNKNDLNKIQIIQ